MQSAQAWSGISPKNVNDSATLLWQGLAIYGHEELEGNLIQLLHLRAEDNAELKRWKHYLSSDIMNEMIGLLNHDVYSQKWCRYV